LPQPVSVSPPIARVAPKALTRIRRMRNLRRFIE
jgi:hypothetical protein